MSGCEAKERTARQAHDAFATRKAAMQREVSRRRWKRRLSEQEQGVQEKGVKMR